MPAMRRLSVRKLTDHEPAAGSKGDACGEFAGSDKNAREREAREVGAGDERTNQAAAQSEPYTMGASGPMKTANGYLCAA
jgi:hypothetical protein